MQQVVVRLQGPNVGVVLAALMFAAAAPPVSHAQQPPTLAPQPGSSLRSPATESSGIGGKSNMADERVLQLERALKYERQVNDELMKRMSAPLGGASSALRQKLDTATRDIEQSLDELRAISRP